MSIDAQLRDLIEFAYANAPAVKARFDQASITPVDVQSVTDLVKVPILPKDEIIALQQANPPFGGLLAVPMKEVRHIFMSPGPIYEPDAGDDKIQRQTSQVALSRSGFEPGDVVINALSYHLVPAGMLLDVALTDMGCPVLPAGVGNSELQVKLMADFKVTGYVGTPSYLMNLIKKAEEAGANFKEDFALSKALVTAEPLPAPLRETLINTYRIQLGNAYATAELGFLALNLEAGLTMPLLPGPIIEILDPETGQAVGPGETGEVVVTTFNHAYPLIRLGTGDMAVNIDPNPGQSNQEDRAIMLVGRSGEACKVRGMFVHPNQLRFAVAQVTQAQAVQGVVSRPADRDHLTVRIALADPNADTKALLEALQASIPQFCRVRADEIVFVSAEEVGQDVAGMVDERVWE